MPQDVKRVIVKTTGRGLGDLRRVADEVQGIGRSANRTSRVLRNFRSTFAAAFAAIGVREIARLSDSFQLLFDRITAFEGAANAEKAFTDLAGAADFTRTRIESLAESYTRVSLATQELGLSQEAIIGFTTGLQQTFRLSGASIAEATASTIQLTQGLSAGALRGQELRSVLEANSIFAGILAREFGVARGQLIKLAETGAITSTRVFEALSENFEELNERAERLGITFSQAVSVGINAIGKELLRLNQNLGVSSAFAQGIEFLANNLRTFSTILGAIVGGGALLALAKGFAAVVAVIPKVVAGFEAFLGVIAFFGGGNVLAAVASSLFSLPVILTAIGTAVGVLAVNFETVAPKILRQVENISVGFNELKIAAIESIQGIFESFGNTTFADNFKEGIDSARESINQSKLDIATYTRIIKENEAANEENAFSVEKFVKALRESVERLKEAATNNLSLTDRVKALNNSFIAGTINIEQYRQAFQRLEVERITQEFKDGRPVIEEYLRATGQDDLTRLNEQLRQGRINLLQFNQGLNTLELERVRRGVDQGTSSIIELNRAALAASDTFDPNGSIFQGASEFVQQAGTLSENVADAINRTFSRLEDSLNEFVNTGKFQFRDFTNAILQDLQRIIIRQTIVRQLAGAFDFSSSTAGGDAAPAAPASTNAKGNVFNNGSVQAFASGGVVTGPTMFGMSGNRMGLMGEAGAEAILPLTRSRNGDLGVKSTPSNVTVNVINNTAADSEVTQNETSDSFGNRTIDIIINNKVNEGFGNGTFDRALRSNFGVARRGN